MYKLLWKYEENYCTLMNNLLWPKLIFDNVCKLLNYDFRYESCSKLLIYNL